MCLWYEGIYVSIIQWCYMIMRYRTRTGQLEYAAYLYMPSKQADMQTDCSLPYMYRTCYSSVYIYQRLKGGNYYLSSTYTTWQTLEYSTSAVVFISKGQID